MTKTVSDLFLVYQNAEARRTNGGLTPADTALMAAISAILFACTHEVQVPEELKSILKA